MQLTVGIEAHINADLIPVKFCLTSVRIQYKA